MWPPGLDRLLKTAREQGSCEMPKPSRDEVGPWVIKEENCAYRIVDTAGTIVAEIPFASRSASDMSRDEAKRMAEDMLSARDVLARAETLPVKPKIP